MPHPNSVIPTWLNNYNPAAYNALTNQENWSYVNQDISGWQPLFQGLANAMNNYRTYSRGGSIQSFMEGTYGYIANGLLYGTDTSQLPNFDGLKICSMNGFLSATQTRPVNYYNDLVYTPPNPPTDPGGYSSARMTADTTTVTGAGSAEAATMRGLADGTKSSLQSMMWKLMFQEVKVQGTVTKSVMANTYFNQLHWKQVFQNLNVDGLPLPPGV